MDKDHLAMDGVKIRGLSPGISQSDIKVYFSNPRNGGGRVSKIFFPLLNHTAVVIFADRNVISGVTRQRHRIKNCDIEVETLPKTIFSKVSVELEPEITQMLDQNSTILEILQFEGELDVNFDPDSMNYTMVGSWYQMEWAWNYLESLFKRKNIPGSVDQGEELINRSNILSPNVPNIPPIGADSRTRSSEFVPKNFAETSREQSNIAWNINLPADTDVPFPYQAFQSNISHTEYRSEKKYTAKRLPVGKEAFKVGEQRFAKTDAHIPLLDNPLRGRDMWTSSFPQHGGFDSDDTDDELAAQYIDDRSSSPEISVPEPQVTRPRRPSPKGIELLHSDFGDMPLTFDANVGCLQIKVIMGDIVKERSDAIVNPTNQTLSNTYGISSAIARMAGRGLMDECKNYVASHGPLEVSQVTKTCAGGALDSQVDFVLHTIPPTWREDESESTSHILTCTYLNCLQMANKQLWLGSLSFPMLGSGGLGIPLDVSVQAFFDAVQLHVSEEKQSVHLQNIRLVSNNQDSTCSVIVVLRSLLDLDQEQAQKGAIDRYLTRSREFKFKAKDFWLDKETPDGKGKAGEEDKKMETVTAQKDSGGNMAGVDNKFKTMGIRDKGFHRVQDESRLSSSMGQGRNITQDRLHLQGEEDIGANDRELSHQLDTDNQKMSSFISNLVPMQSVGKGGVNSGGVQVQGTGDQIWSTGDQIQGTGGQIWSSGDQIRSTGDQIQGTRGQIWSSGDQIHGTGNQIQGTGDQIWSSGDKIQGTGGQIRSSGDQIQGTGVQIQGSDVIWKRGSSGVGEDVSFKADTILHNENKSSQEYEIEDLSTAMGKARITEVDTPLVNDFRQGPSAVSGLAQTMAAGDEQDSLQLQEDRYTDTEPLISDA
ncbi:uncharacterized protein [Argopecten irradians]|uniref:uncharacterized protein n=1 Tax=Argopecten irradians TaxID=31199 RepID=UPI0037153BD6